MAKWCWLGIHKWTKWTPPKTIRYTRYIRYIGEPLEEYETSRDEQYRKCENCGKQEMRIL